MLLPIISIIVPVYNAEKWLNRCVDSILVQTLSDFELLLVDDGSTDNSSAICEEYAVRDSRVRVFHKNNGGVSSARNLGLENAVGEWVTFCDSDDYVSPSWLQNYCLKENSDKSVICQGLVKFSHNDINNIEFAGEYRGACEGDACKVLDVLFIKGMLGWIHIKAFQLSKIKERYVTFDENQKFREDEKFFLEYLRPTDKLILYDMAGYFYQVTDTNKYEDWKCTLDFSRCIYNNVNRLGFKSGNVLRTYFANEYKTTLLRYIQINDGEHLFDELLELIREEYRYIHIFPLTKFILRYDITRVLSKMIFKLHLILKNKHNK